MMSQNSHSERLTSENIINYLQEKYAMGKDIVEIGGRELVIPQFTMAQFNSKSSTLTAITSIVKFYRRNKENQEVYDLVTKIAKQYLYDGKSWGLIPFISKAILGQAFYYYVIKHSRFQTHYFKNIGFNINKIISIINKCKPIIMSMRRDGRNCYHNHSVVIVGYVDFQDENGKVKRMLLIHDGVEAAFSYLDYDEISTYSLICY